MLKDIMSDEFPAVALTSDQLVPYRSEYLANGYKRDQTRLSRVEITNGSIRGWVDVTRYDMPSDGVYHFTAPLALLWVAQLAIVYACIDNKLPEKIGEAYLREFNIKCRRPINLTENIEFSLDLLTKSVRGSTVYYKGSFEVNKRSFLGSASFVLPLAIASGLRIH